MATSAPDNNTAQTCPNRFLKHTLLQAGAPQGAKNSIKYRPKDSNAKLSAQMHLAPINDIQIPGATRSLVHLGLWLMRSRMP